MIAAGRDVTFLVHPGTLKQLTRDGLRVRGGADTQTIQVKAVAVEGLNGPYDVVVVAVRAGAVESVIRDIDGAVGPRTRIVPIVNGIRHLSLLTAAFGQDRVLGATARLAASLLPDGTIDVLAPGVHMELGQLDGGHSDALDDTAAELDVDNVAVTLRSDVINAMWEKFALITATAALTCLVGEQIGPIAQADGGIDLARAILAEVASVAEAEATRLQPTSAPASTPFSPTLRLHPARRCFATFRPTGRSKSMFSLILPHTPATIGSARLSSTRLSS